MGKPLTALGKKSGLLLDRFGSGFAFFEFALFGGLYHGTATPFWVHFEGLTPVPK